MRKFMVVALFIALLVLFATPSYALTASADLMLGGQFEINNSAGDNNFDGTLYIFNVEQVLKGSKFKFGGDLLTGAIDQNGSTVDYSGYDLKGGFRIINTDSMKIDLTFSLYNGALSGSGTIYDSYYELYYDYSYEDDITGGLIGADLVYNASDKSYFEASVAFSLFANVTDIVYIEGDSYSDSADSASILNLKLKYNYLISDNAAIGIGYRNYGTTMNFGSNSVDFIVSGIIAGFTYHL